MEDVRPRVGPPARRDPRARGAPLAGVNRIAENASAVADDEGPDRGKGPAVRDFTSRRGPVSAGSLGGFLRGWIARLGASHRHPLISVERGVTLGKIIGELHIADVLPAGRARSACPPELAHVPGRVSGVLRLEHLVPGAAPLSSQRRQAPAGHHRQVPNQPVEYDASHQFAIISGFQLSAILTKPSDWISPNMASGSGRPRPPHIIAGRIGLDNKGYRGHQVWPESGCFPRILIVFWVL